MESRSVVVDGVRAHCVVAGEGPPLLFAPGLGSSVKVAWKRVIQPLTRRFMVHALDMPGNGDADRPDVPYHFEEGVRFLHRSLDQLGLSRVNLIGSSAGGLLSLVLALRYPERVDRLVLVDSAGLGREIGLFLRLCTIPLLGEILAMPHGLLLRMALRGVYSNPTLVDDAMIDELTRVRRQPGTGRAMLRVLRQHVDLGGLKRRLILLDKLHQLRQPTLILWGEHDTVIPVAHAYAAARVIPDCRLEVFPGCGHDPAWEQPERFREVVSDFLLAPALTPARRLE